MIFIYIYSDLLTRGAHFSINQTSEFENFIDDEDDFNDDNDDDDNELIAETYMSPWLHSFEELRKLMNQLPDVPIFKRIIVPGTGDAIGETRVRIILHYNLFFESATEAFDSTCLQGRPLNGLFDEVIMIPGMALAIRTMCSGEEAQFVIDYSLMFGSVGCPPRIPPNADVLMTVKVLNIVDVGDGNAIAGLNAEDRKLYVNVKKTAIEMEKGVKDMFHRGRYENAIQTLHTIISPLQYCNVADEAENIDREAILIRLHSRLLDCLIKKQDWKKSCSVFNEINRLSNGNVDCKALTYNGIALQRLGEFDRAISNFKKAQRMDPHNSLVNRELKNTVQRKNEYEKYQRDFYKKMFSN